MNLIYNAFYFENGHIKSPNMFYSNGVSAYLKQSYVSLKSAKLSNPNCDVAIVSNQLIPAEYQTLFEKERIRNIIVPFELYRMPKTFQWEFAFYKLAVLSYMANSNYENVLGVDTDTYFSESIDTLWKECSYHIPVLYVLPVNSNTEIRKNIINDYQKITGEHIPLLHFGGEFIAGSRHALKALNFDLERIYKRIKDNDFQISADSGDEALLSMAMAKKFFSCGNAFIHRYWSRRAFYNVDTAWKWTPIWHLPAEKNYGLAIMYRYLISHDQLMKKQSSAQLFNLPKQRKYNKSMIQYYFFNLLKRIR